MTVAKGRLLLDPYKWLPGYGENSVSLEFRSGELFLRIVYDDKADQNRTKTLVLVFIGVSSYSFSACPGPGMGEKQLKVDTGGTNLTSLCEWEGSELAEAWTKHWGNRRNIRHFGIYFAAENQILAVLAEEWRLLDA